MKGLFTAKVKITRLYDYQTWRKHFFANFARMREGLWAFCLASYDSILRKNVSKFSLRPVKPIRVENKRQLLLQV